MFTAAGIAHDPRELEYFMHPDDTRFKQYYLVPKAKLLEVSDLGDYLQS